MGSSCERRTLAVSAIVIRMDQVRAGRALAQRASDLAGVGRRLVAARLAKGLRQRDLAGISGLGTNTIANWETGARRPRIDQLALVLPVLEVSSDWIYFADDRALSWQVREAVLRALETLASDSTAAPTASDAA
jgi:transcriptional regulator with XRE-family HTH domain